MSFDSLAFILCLGAFLFLYRTVPAPRFLALAASIAFYAVAGWFDLGLVLVVKLVNFWASRFVTPDQGKHRRVALIAIIAANISTLAFFKYRNFLSGGGAQDIFGMDILIPLGISFYIFQIIAYQIDLYRGKIARISSLPSFLLFALYFPQLIAGPIVRAGQLAPQIRRLERDKHRPPAPRIAVSFGLGLLVIGLFKKVVLADSLSPWIDAAYTQGVHDSFTAWIVAWAFNFQIYFDFSGYSDMAVGMAALMGIRLPMNFRQPYLSKSPQEYWQRWHTTLSSWIRDYLYIPLGGSKGGAVRNTATLVLVMGLAGLWHGANWTFIIWGVAWGMVIFLYRLIKAPLRNRPILGWTLTMMIITVLFVIFRAPTIEQSLNYIGILFGADGNGNLQLGATWGSKILLLLGCVSLVALHWIEHHLMSMRVLRRLMRWDHPIIWGILAGLALWLVILPKMSTTPFIYFRF